MLEDVETVKDQDMKYDEVIDESKMVRVVRFVHSESNLYKVLYTDYSGRRYGEGHFFSWDLEYVYKQILHLYVGFSRGGVSRCLESRNFIDNNNNKKININDKPFSELKFFRVVQKNLGRLQWYVTSWEFYVFVMNKEFI